MISRYTKEEREQAVREFKASGLSGNKFCEERGICRTTFSGWVNGYKKSSKNTNALSEDKNSSSFVRLAKPKSVSSKVRAEVSYKGASIKVCGEEAIEAVIKALCTFSERNL